MSALVSHHESSPQAWIYADLDAFVDQPCSIQHREWRRASSEDEGGRTWVRTVSCLIQVEYDHR